MSIRKKLLILTGTIIIGIFAVVNIIWFFGMRYKNISYMKTVNSDMVGKMSYGGQYGDYSLRVKPAGYLSYDSGFLSLSNRNSGSGYIDEDDNIVIDDTTDISFYIWPRFGDSYSIGLMVFESDNIYQIIINEQLEPLNTESEYYDKYKEYIADNYDNIIGMMQAAHELWGYNFEVLNNPDV